MVVELKSTKGPKCCSWYDSYTYKHPSVLGIGEMKTVF